jgi:glycosyltransferase involved in cell wall biosynthesis
VHFEEKYALDISGAGKVSVSDQYRFIKKYYSPVWSLYILLLRLLSFNNPVRETGGFLKSLKVKKQPLYNSIKDWSKIEKFRSGLIDKQPMVSVIIPTLNRYEYLDDVLKDLEKQDYENFEVIVCDQSEPVDEEFYKNRDLDLKLIVQEEKALWLARNRSIKESRGEYILLFDDDSRVEPDWISSHLKCIDFFNVEISSGVSLSTVGGKIPANYSFYRWGDQVDTGNVMVHKDVFKTTGLFDRQFEKQRMGDGEFGLRCYLAGFKNISNPDAKRVQLKVSTGGLRQMGSWDAFRTKKLLAPRPVPSVLYLVRKYYGKANAFFMLMNSVPPSVMPYKFKKSKLLRFLGYPITLILFPFVFVLVLKSWNIASRMLREGDKIEWL